ncbi:DNA-(apurinic or apyrimidinic site) lyase /endonuclease III [Hypnocyclicus thermotrophus]|uniref:Endonuclease III n=1 Tax=Hypnocyclicus thermotrophus TaxID=1627895 RepID=A0AA46I5K8_9FUSO|nr:endonuclease III [Hypnocyclicus thermotrophus]TDT70596.1 DNA-(apurinic or apyrimidinic site) lyase /endonuclease III [Hypnocyclicus thermotrophus]
MNRRERLENIIAILKKEYGESKVMLNYNTPFELLIAVILSAQCTDKRVNMVTKEMYKIVNTPEGFANMEVEEIEKLIKSTGFYRNKAKNIKQCSIDIIEKYDGKVPMNMDDLINLAGVGRKTANVVMGDITKEPEGIVVDTHVKRLSNRIGFVKTNNPIIIERELMKWVPKKYWFDYPNLLIRHGRAICKARKAECNKCGINEYCKKNI